MARRTCGFQAGSFSRREIIQKSWRRGIDAPQQYERKQEERMGQKVANGSMRNVLVLALGFSISSCGWCYWYWIFVFGETMRPWPNNILKPPTVAACRSAVAVHVASRRWFGLVR